MKTLLLLVISSGFVLAQQKMGNCSPLAPTIAVGQMQRLNQEHSNQLLQLEAQLRVTQEKYTADHPDVRALKQRIDSFAAQQKQPLPRKMVGFGPQSCRNDMWWKNEATAREVGLTADQIKRMDDVFQQYRIKLVDLNAALEKEEIIMEPLVSADQVDEAKVAAEIDRIAQARAELEKANGRMLLGIRKQLTPEQWNKLNGR